MAFTRRLPVYGSKPPSAYASRLEERRQLMKTKRLERTRKADKSDDYVIHQSSEEEDDEYNDVITHRILFSSNNFADYIRAREYASKEYHTFDTNYGTRHVLSHDMLKEKPVILDQNVNKILCSAWLSHRQVVFGTQCNKLMVYDVITKAVDKIPCLIGNNEPLELDECKGIHALSINPSYTLLATGGKNSNEIGIYKLPTLDPVNIGEQGHDGRILDITWLDDQFLVSCSCDTKVVLWRVPEVEPASRDIPLYSSINPAIIRTCKRADKVQAFAFNKCLSELAAISVNGYVHIWNLERFKQTISSKLTTLQEPSCMCVNESGTLYAVGCRSHTLLIDSRRMRLVKKISNTRYSGVVSISFKNDLLTIGSGVGVMVFYDLRAEKHLESVNASRSVILRTNQVYVNPEEEYVENGLHCNQYTPAIYTHCYDRSGLRLFCAGGPLTANLNGNYASVWQ